ncbi:MULTISPECIES: hypothetical protein [Nostoc]|uniref:Glycine zipper 2TM domain-containing protein n=1 Tax=Nostoc paludosum FACHB-159 TaxID=2692908 RepID=A0ABR8KG61_9NOSO|nr:MULTISPECIES: hypothetical protein [Nostoc]MBD2680657.1 hypothetical protein [Nostoc sp. FACHB-857]MBD2737052.1 hypothetical protein [Nostoc paludosum FACHB-159]
MTQDKHSDLPAQNQTSLETFSNTDPINLEVQSQTSLETSSHTHRIATSLGAVGGGIAGAALGRSIGGKLVGQVAWS